MIDSLKIDCDNIKALLKRISPAAKLTSSCINPEKADATFDADAEVTKFHDGLLKMIDEHLGLDPIA